MFLFVVFILSVIFVEALTELIIKSELLLSWRERQKSRDDFSSKLFSCGYCFSFWSAAIASFIYSLIVCRLLLGPPGPNHLLFFPIWIFFILVLQRCSNYLHNFNDKWLDKYYTKKD